MREEFKTMKVTIPIPTSVNKYLMTVRGRQIKTNEARKCEEELVKIFTDAALDQKWIMPKDKFRQVEIHYKFYFDKANRDTNNYYKVPLDCIKKTGLIIQDDNILTEHVDSLLYDRNNPRMELLFKVSDKIGIFESYNDYGPFKENCKTCSKYRNGKCTILNDSKHGYIREEVSDIYICNKYKLKKN